MTYKPPPIHWPSSPLDNDTELNGTTTTSIFTTIEFDTTTTTIDTEESTVATPDDDEGDIIGGIGSYYIDVIAGGVAGGLGALLVTWLCVAHVVCVSTKGITSYSAGTI